MRYTIALCLLLFASSVFAQTPASFFGMTTNSYATGHTPTGISYGVLRFWDTPCVWSLIETSNGTYNWTNCDAQINYAVSVGASPDFVMGRTPSWAITGTCSGNYSGSSGCAQLPSDLNGANSILPTFLTALYNHMHSSFPSVKWYIEGLNEADLSGECAVPSTVGSGFCAMSDLALYQKTLYNTLHSLDSSNHSIVAILGPAASTYNQFGPHLYPGTDNTSYPYTGAGLMNAINNLGGGPYMDMINMHPYFFCSGNSCTVPETAIGAVSALASAMTGSFASLPIIDSESDWGHGTANTQAENLKAAYLGRLYAYLWNAGHTGVWWYSWDNNSGNLSSGFGTLCEGTIGSPPPPSCTPNAAATAYATWYGWLVGSSHTVNSCNTNVDGNGSYYCPFTLANGNAAAIIFNSSGTNYSVSANGFTTQYNQDGTSAAITGNSVTAGIQPIMITTPNCPTGAQCGATAIYCASYTPPSTTGATAISSLPFNITAAGNYYLSGDLSSTTNGIYITYSGGSAIDINLNGHTLTYGTTANGSGSTQIGEYGILMCNTGNLASEGLDSSYGSNGQCISGGLSAKNVTIENGTITQSPNASQYFDPNNCPGSGVDSGSGGACSHPHDTVASHAIHSEYNSGLTVKHVTINIQNVDSRGILFQWQQAGNGMDIECNTINDKVLQINKRSEAHAAIWDANQAAGNHPNTIQYNTILGSPQGGIVVGAGATEISGSVVQFNDINQGYFQGPPYTSALQMYTNDYAIGGCIPAGTIQYNYVHSVNGRGIGCIYGSDQNNEVISNNYISVAELAVNGEYGANGAVNGGTWAGGCEIDGGRGFEVKGSFAVQLYSNTLINNVSQCGAGGIALVELPCQTISCPSTATYPISIHDNNIQINNTSGSSTTVTPQDAACYILDNGQGNYSNYFLSILRDNCTTDGDLVVTDGYDGGDYFNFYNLTYTVGSHPLASGCGGASSSTCGHMMHWQGQQGPPPDELGFVFRDISFANGAAATFSNAPNAPLARAATVQWTQTITVQNGSSAPINGATVTYTDALSNHYTCTTNSSGVCTVAVSQEQVSGAAGVNTLTTTSYNNYSRAVSASGYATNNASGINVTSTNSVTVTLASQGNVPVNAPAAMFANLY